MSEQPKPGYFRTKIEQNKVRRRNSAFTGALTYLASTQGGDSVQKVTEAKRKKLPRASLVAFDEALVMRFGALDDRLTSDKARAKALKAGFIMGGLIMNDVGTRDPFGVIGRRYARDYFTEHAQGLVRDARLSVHGLEHVLERWRYTDYGNLVLKTADPKLKVYNATDTASGRESQELYTSAFAFSGAASLLMLAEASVERRMTKREARHMGAAVDDFWVQSQDLNIDNPPEGSDQA